jgi:acetate kinase
MCAIKMGRSIASTMGFSALDGLPMGSRSGAIDPGVLLYLQRHYQMDADALETFLYKACGWKGVSGLSSDMLPLKQSAVPQAKKAIDMFCYRAALEIGKLAAALQGVDKIVFTGGVGENDADIRAAIAEQCEWLGAQMCTDANQNNSLEFSTKASPVTLMRIATNEELMIAQHCHRLS